MATEQDKELLRAVMAQDLSRVEQALNNGANINYATTDPIADEISDIYDVHKGSTAALLAADFNDNPAILDLLIQKGADLTVKNVNQSTVLMMAASIETEKTPELLKKLLKQKSVQNTINAGDNEKMTALHVAIYISDNIELVKSLLEHGADPTLTDDLRRQPLESLMFAEHPELFEIYLNNQEKAVQESIAHSPTGIKFLKYAAKKGNSALMKRLTDLGVLQNIASLEAEKIVDILYADLYEDLLAGNTGLLSLLEDISTNLDKDKLKAVYEIFKSKNIDLSYSAVAFGKLKLAENLSLAGGNFSGRYDIKYGHLTVTENTLLHIAAHSDQTQMIDFLVKQGVDLNAVNDHLETPLYLATEDGHVEFAQAMIKQGANTAIPNINSETPLGLAQYFGLEPLVKSLINIPERKVAEDSDPFIQDALFIKKMGHALGMKASIPLKTGVPGKKTSIVTEGHDPLLSIEHLLEFLNEYTAKSNLSVETKQDFEKIIAAFKINEKFLQYDGSVTEEDLLNHFKAGDLTIVTSGWKKHTTAELLYKDKMVDSNRGEGIGVSGTLIRNIQDLSKITVPYLRSLNPPGVRKQKKEIIANLAQAVDLNSFEDALPTKPQKWGTCSFVNPKALIMAMLYMLRLEKLRDAQQRTQAESPALLSALAAQQETALKKQALEYAKHEYKKFTHFLRNTAVETLLKNYYDNKATPQRKEVAFNLLVDYIIAHHGKAKKSDDSPRALKRKQEVERVERIFKGLEEQDRKKLLQALGKKGVILYEVAKSALDDEYHELLQDKWPITKTDLLLQQDSQGCTPLIRAVIKYDSSKLLSELMNTPNASEWINAKDNNGNTALHYAVIAGNKKMVELLANHPDIDLSSQDKTLHTPFGLATKNSNAGIMKILALAEEKQKEARALRHKGRAPGMPPF